MFKSIFYKFGKLTFKIISSNNNTNNRWFLEHPILLKALLDKDYRDNK